MALAGQFDRPIPGEALTGEPKNNPWESPPQMAEITDVTKYYINKLANQDVIDDFAAMCQAGAPLKPIVQSITQQGMMRGLHTVDASMLVSPIIHQFLKQAIEAMGVEVDDDGRDLQAEAEAAEMNRFLVLATKYLQDNPEDMQDPGKALIQEIVEETKEEEPEQEKPKGLMARG
jgi:hypothetical protein